MVQGQMMTHVMFQWTQTVNVFCVLGQVATGKTQKFRLTVLKQSFDCELHHAQINQIHEVVKQVIHLPGDLHALCFHTPGTN